MRTSGIAGAAIVLMCLGCSPPPAGVLTLAPAGMRTKGACVANRDGTLDASFGASAESLAYMDAAPATVTITAHTLGGAASVGLGLWVDGTERGTATVSSKESAAFPLHLEPKTGGPHALRLVLAPSPDSSTGATPVLHIEKVVITQP